jgi:hypothetical protein
VLLRKRSKGVLSTTKAKLRAGNYVRRPKDNRHIARVRGGRLSW